MGQIAEDFAAAPEGALVISPDNASRQELNTLICGKLQARESVPPDALTATVQVARQELGKENKPGTGRLRAAHPASRDR